MYAIRSYYVRQAGIKADNFTSHTHDLGDIAYELAQAIHPWPTEVVALSEGVMIVQRADKGLDHILHVHGLKTRFRAGEREGERRYPQERGETVNEAVMRTENHRWPEAVV